MKYIISVIIIMLPIISIAGSDLAMEILNNNLGGMIEVKSDSIIEFCPTHKCDTFIIQNPSPDFSSYVFLYLYHNVQYLTIEEAVVYKEQRFQKNTKAEESEIRQKMEHYCKEEDITPECILSGMRSALSIKDCWSNYDEGNYCVVCDGKTTCEKL